MDNIDKTLSELMKQSGLNAEDFKKLLADTVDKQEKARKQEEEKKKQEEKRAQEMADVGNKLCDIANRALAGKLTSDDVCYLYRLYAKQEYKDVDDDVWKCLIDPDSIKNSVKMAVTFSDGVSGLLKELNMSWADVTNQKKKSKDDIRAASRHNVQVKRNDDDILRDFLNTL